MWKFLNTLPDGTQRFVILAKKAFTLKSHRHSLGWAAKQAEQAEVKQRWLPINLVGNFQQTQLKRPEIHKISILSHRYIHILRRALTAQGQLHLLFVLHFCCCFVVVFFRRWNYTVTANIDIDIHTDPSWTEPNPMAELKHLKRATKDLSSQRRSLPLCPSAANQMYPNPSSSPSLVQPQSVTN